MNQAVCASFNCHAPPGPDRPLEPPQMIPWTFPSRSAVATARPAWFVMQVAPQAASFLGPWLAWRGFLTRRFTHSRPRRKRKPLQVESFPGYLFVRFDRRSEEWPWLLSLPGVIGLLGMDRATPVAVSEAEMVRLGEAHDAFYGARPAPVLVATARYAPGDTVQITAGPLTRFLAVVLDGDKELVKVNVAIFGRSAEVTLKNEDVTKYK